MDDLDALLADLQTNLSKGSPHPASQLSPVSHRVKNGAEPKSYTVITEYPAYRTPSPAHPYGEERRDVRFVEYNGGGGPANGHVSRVSPEPRPILTSTPNNATLNGSASNQQSYRHEKREEVRTESRSSGPYISSTTPRAAVNDNLSELDSLLQDLNTSRSRTLVKETALTNGTRPSVDSLLDELNSVGNKRTIETRLIHQDSRRIPQERTVRVSASNATRELDDLMDSLSDFKKQDKLRSPALVRKYINKDNNYAKPLPRRRSPSPPPKPTPQPPPPQPPPCNQLDSMLGTLTSHMTEQGITTSQKGCCCACDKPIVGQVITALGKTWHPEHFVCYHCKEELGTKNFFERDGRPYCEPDYHKLFSPKCAYCSAAILDKCVTAMNQTWHPEHFFCAQCGKTFGEDGFHEKNGKPYCKTDYFNMFAPKCGGCNNPIMENYISALNAQWHPNCFVCRDCNQPFNGGSFFDHEGLPYCETHYHAKRGSLCAACGKPITGRCITAMFKKFHPEHFLCSFCLQQLNKGTFKDHNNKPYCHECFDKLYG